MSKIESSLGIRTFTSGPAKQILTVSDESGGGQVDPFALPGEPGFDASAHKSTIRSTFPTSPYNFPPPAPTFQAPPYPAPSAPQQLDRSQMAEMNTRKQEARSNAQRVTPEARNRIEHLVGIARVETEVPIGEYTFVLQSLKSREMREAVKASSAAQTLSEQVFEVRLQTLARAIITVDGHALDLVLGTSNLADKIAFLDELGDHVVGHLYKKYSEMINKSESSFIIKSAAEAEEVAAEIKK